MARSNTKRQSRPAPQPELTPSNASAIVEIGGTVNKSGRPNLFAVRSTERTKLVEMKRTLLATVSQRLAEAADLMAEGRGNEKDARTIAEKEALRLYQGRVADTISADEVTETLGNVFGRKPLTSGPKAGQPGKTPDGLGEDIRKRIVRAVAATEYVTNGDGGRFFVGLPDEPIREIVQSIDNKARASELRDQAERALAADNAAEAETLTAQAVQLEASALSLWSAYDYFGKVKSDAANAPVNFAFDAGKIAKMVESLSANGAVAAVRENKPLFDAYAELYAILNIIGEPEGEGEEGAE